MRPKLPARFLISHDVCFALHDELARCVIEGERAQLQFFETKLRSPEHAQALAGLDRLDFWCWCESNGYRDILDQFTYRSLIFALLADMCQFVYEGLECSRKGKLSVAFALFRKPLQDNLLFLEWILADWPEFQRRFRAGAEHLDLGKLPPEQRKEIRRGIIADAMDKTPSKRWITPEWLYELRYDKDSDLSLDPVFNHALHLVTTHKTYATSPENMNFLFCDDDNREELWNRLYLLLPAVLMHALQIARGLFQTLKPDFFQGKEIAALRLTAGLLLCAERAATHRGDQSDPDSAKELFSGTLMPCPQCGKALKDDLDGVQAFWDDGQLTCVNCRTVFSLLKPTHVVGYEKHKAVNGRFRRVAGDLLPRMGRRLWDALLSPLAMARRLLTTCRRLVS